MVSPVKAEFWDSFLMRFGAALGSTLVPTPLKMQWKNNLKNVPKNHAGEITQFIRKSSEMDAKTDAKVDSKCQPNRNLRFLYFCKGYNVEIVFWDDQGT